MSNRITEIEARLQASPGVWLYVPWLLEKVKEYEAALREIQARGEAGMVDENGFIAAEIARAVLERG